MNQARFDFRIYPVVMMLWFVLASFADTLLAQSPGEAQEASFAIDNTVPEKVSDSDRLSAARLPPSSVPWFLRDMRSSAGFSLGAYGAYDSNAVISSPGQKPEALKSAGLAPSLFANVRKRRSQVLLSYTLQANAYSGFSQLNNSSHRATLNFTRAVSPKLSVGLGEFFSSALNDQRTFLDPTVLGSYELKPAQDLDVPPQRVTQNSLSANVRYQMSRRNSISVFSSYDYWRYSDTSLGNSQDVVVGVHSGFRINKWLYLDNSYSRYVNVGNNPLGLGDNQIQRLQVGGLRIRSRRGWEAFLSGGSDISTSNGTLSPVPSLQGGISKDWQSGRFAAVYSRGFWTAVGPGTALQGDTANLSFSQFLRRVSFTIGSTYRRGTASGDSSADFVSISEDVGFAVQRHLRLSANYWYVSQRVLNISPVLQNASRYRVGVGINCSLPPLFNR